MIVKTMKYLLKYIGIVLTVIQLSGCDTPVYKKHNEQSVLSERESEQDSKQSINKQTSKIKKDYTLTRVTLSNVLQSILVTLKTNDRINKKELACIERIDTAFSEKQVQHFFESKFTEQELQNLNKFYKSDVAIAYTAYRRDQLLMSSGFKIEKAIKKLNKTDIKVIEDFSNSALGLKYIKITKENDEDSLTAIIIPLLIKEIQQCGIQL